MDEFLKMDIFFVVATVALVIITVLLAIFLFYAIRVVRTASKLGMLVEQEFALIKGDIDDARLSVKREAGQLLALISTARKIVARFISSRTPRD